jgi:hypothetical protein
MSRIIHKAIVGRPANYGNLGRLLTQMKWHRQWAFAGENIFSVPATHVALHAKNQEGKGRQLVAWQRYSRQNPFAALAEERLKDISAQR